MTQTTGRAPASLAVVLPFEQAALLLAIAEEARSIRRRRDEHRARGGKDTEWAKRLPIGTVGALCVLVDDLDAVLASEEVENR